MPITAAAGAQIAPMTASVPAATAPQNTPGRKASPTPSQKHFPQKLSQLPMLTASATINPPATSSGAAASMNGAATTTAAATATAPITPMTDHKPSGSSLLSGLL